MTSNQLFLQNLYDDFNRREVETIIASMQPEVKWANGLTGGFVYGRDAVREYWTEQFKSILPELETRGFETDADGNTGSSAMPFDVRKSSVFPCNQLKNSRLRRCTYSSETAA